MHGHFGSRDKDSVHTNSCVIAKNSMLRANLMALSFTEPELWTIEFYNAEIGIFNLFCFLWPWPWPNDLHIWTWPVFSGDTLDMQI